ncbi:hypothetical protein K3M35_25560, partial [Rhodococcus sp. DMU2021]|nr:hypothetical protein [Rhodococcus sp. DMU2021]
RQRVLELRAQGLKLREIAEQVGMTTGGVGTILHHARKAAKAREETAKADVGADT